ncbi:MAG: flavin reductase family protein [Acidimicrobiaceae bacterium]|nr:flavin reductase family protein [Acidimicrobiaceae bacterium]MBT5848940.1 flavin reductase family protein [Acidimicrobiaceae bacterium]
MTDSKQQFDPAELSADECYRLLSSVVVPRPIAWVSTVSADGVPNLAPHSYFNAMGANPPLVAFSADRGGDTAINLSETSEFVVNIVSGSLAEAMELTAAAVPGDVDEFDLAGLTKAPAVDIGPSLVEESPVSLECVVREVRPSHDSLMIIGEVVRFHVLQGLLGPTGRVEPDLLDPLGRLGMAYTRLGDVFRQDRPTAESLGLPDRDKQSAPRIHGGAHLVGSVPRDSGREVMELCAAQLGDQLASIPDGETGDRLDWTTVQAVHVFHPNPDLETISQPASFTENPDAWRPGDLKEDAWLFRVRDGVGLPRFDGLGYVEAAVASYGDFVGLRQSGVIPSGIRFQVSLPSPQSAVSWWFHDPDDADRVNIAYSLAMAEEVSRLCAAIPHEDLTIQWDACWETVVLEDVFDWAPAGDPMHRIAQQTPIISMDIPEDVVVGYHLCYGSMHDEHFVEPADLSKCVGLANFLVNNSGRRIDFVHMPIPIDRDDDAFFMPLRDLRVGDAFIYLGLVHFEDGGDGARRRMATARRHLHRFGVAAECGMGRMHPDQVIPLLQAHVDAL